MQEILVVSRRAGGTRAPAGYRIERVDRTSPLGNPFPMTHENQRDSVCDQYALWLDQQIASNNPPVMAAFNVLLEAYRRGEALALECWCAPRRCHAESIRAAILRAHP
jgi:hypothetical protein